MIIINLSQVHRRESNFVRRNYKLILEFDEGSHWFWHADVDGHGMTRWQCIILKIGGPQNNLTRKLNEHGSAIPKAMAVNQLL
jgi:hypothetical protein